MYLSVIALLLQNCSFCNSLVQALTLLCQSECVRYSYSLHIIDALHYVNICINLRKCYSSLN